MTTTVIDFNDAIRSCMQCDCCIHGADYTGKECDIHELTPEDILTGKRRCPDMRIEDPKLLELTEQCIRKWYPDIAEK